MTRLYVICEGATEERFVQDVLYDRFRPRKIYLYPTLIGKPGHKGGNVRFDRLYIDLRNLLQGDQHAYCTTFFDYYALPPDFPGKDEAQKKRAVSDKYGCIVRALTDRVREKLGDAVARRFIPYVQMYEFEGLLFSDPEKLAKGINRVDLADHFHTIRKRFHSPEEINDSVHTAPSKRIVPLFAGYEKPWHGAQAALEMGLETIETHCPLFGQWLHHINTLASC